MKMRTRRQIARIARKQARRKSQLSPGGNSRYARKKRWLASSGRIEQPDGSVIQLRGSDVPEPKPWK
jgi:hypothetical protein